MRREKISSLTVWFFIALFFGVGAGIGLLVASIYGRPFAGAVLMGSTAGAVGVWAVFAIAFRLRRYFRPPGAR